MIPLDAAATTTTWSCKARRPHFVGLLEMIYISFFLNGFKIYGDLISSKSFLSLEKINLVLFQNNQDIKEI